MQAEPIEYGEMTTSEGLGEESIPEEYRTAAPSVNEEEEDDDGDTSSLGFDPLSDQLRGLGLDNDEDDDDGTDRSVQRTIQQSQNPASRKQIQTKRLGLGGTLLEHNVDTGHNAGDTESSSLITIAEHSTHQPTQQRRPSLSREFEFALPSMIGNLNLRGSQDSQIGSSKRDQSEDRGSYSAPPSFGRSSSNGGGMHNSGTST